jgi:glycerate kinase
MRILVAPNAFKGSLSAAQAAEAMKKGVLAAVPAADVLCLPVADGGDGLTEVMTGALAGTVVRVQVKGPRMNEQEACFCLVADQGLAVIEMAKASGLALLSDELRDPTRTTTYGTGQLIGAALDAGVRRIIVGLGGSATCDGGIGMAAALGYRFLDRNGRELAPIGGSLPLVEKIDDSGRDRRLAKVTVTGICDVNNPLTGENGASRVYSPQKGATPGQVKMLDDGLANLARVVARDLGRDIDRMVGAGAAGGLGGGLHAFLGAKLERGIDVVIDLVGLKEKIRGADLVLTAEGRIDFQTACDKAPAGVARAAKEAGVPCLAVCGSVGERIDELYDIGIAAVFSLCRGPQTLDYAMRHAEPLLVQAVEQVVRAFLAGSNPR